MRLDAPPRGARLLLCLLAPPEVRDAVDGDLRERFTRALGETGQPHRARWWYRREVARSAWALVAFGLRPRPGAASTLVAAILLGAMVPLAPQFLAAGFDFVRRSPASYSSLLAANLVLATLLAPLGGALAARLARTRSLAGPAGVAVLMIVPPVLAIGLCPGSAPLWSRFAWTLLVPAAALVGGSGYVAHEASR